MRRKPAGKRGFVKAVGEQLMFADNTRCASGAPTCRPMRCSKPGRGDPPTGQAPVGPGLQPGAPASSRLALGQPERLWRRTLVRDTQQLSAESLRKLDLWIKA
jgi:hypothetical protein